MSTDDINLNQRGKSIGNKSSLKIKIEKDKISKNYSTIDKVSNLNNQKIMKK